jgi:hypothetical protein
MSPQVALPLESTRAPIPRFVLARCQASIELYWLPLGAGGWFVRLNGRIWEAVHALLERRRPLALYHSALEVHVPEGRFVVENCWPIPDGDGPSRGVVVEGPVANRRLARWRVFRYEVRRWRDGVIADAEEAVGSPQRLSDDPRLARQLLALVAELPSPAWGRDELVTGEMWNSNSVVAWLLARSGLPTDAIRPPAGGRAPGWAAGLVVAHREQGGAATGGPGGSFGGTRMVARPATLRGGIPPPRRCQPAPDPHEGAALDPAPVRLARAEDSVRAGAADLGHRPLHPDPRRAAFHLVELTGSRPVMPTQR